MKTMMKMMVKMQSRWLDGHLRHTSFQGVREGKAPHEVAREQPVAPPK
jgi:hypothetical protein